MRYFIYLVALLFSLDLVHSTIVTCATLPYQFYPFNEDLFTQLFTYVENSLSELLGNNSNITIQFFKYETPEQAINLIDSAVDDTQLITCLPALNQISKACTTTSSTCLLLTAGVSVNAAPPTLPTLFFSVPTALSSLQAVWNHIRRNYAVVPNACIQYFLADNFSGETFKQAIPHIQYTFGVVNSTVITLPLNMSPEDMRAILGKKFPCSISFTNYPNDISAIAETLFEFNPSSLLYTYPFIEVNTTDTRLLTTDFFPINASGEYPITSQRILDNAKRWNLTVGQHLAVAEITSAMVSIATTSIVNLTDVNNYSDLFFSSSLLFQHGLAFGPFVPGNFCVNPANFGQVPGNYAWRTWFITSHATDGTSSATIGQASVLTPSYQGVECTNETSAKIVYMMNSDPYIIGSPSIDATSGFSTTIAAIERGSLVVTGVFEQNHVNIAATSGSPLTADTAINIIDAVLNLTGGRFLSLGGSDNIDITRKVLDEIVVPRDLLIFGSLTDASEFANYTGYITSFRSALSDQVFAWLNAVNKTQGSASTAVLGFCDSILLNETLSLANFFVERYKSLNIPFPTTLPYGLCTFSDAISQFTHEVIVNNISAVLFTNIESRYSQQVREAIPNNITLYFTSSSSIEEPLVNTSTEILPNTYAVSSHYPISNPQSEFQSVVDQFHAVVGNNSFTGPAFVGFYTALALSSYVAVLSSLDPQRFKTAVLTLPAISVAGLRFGPFENCVFGAKQVFVNALSTSLKQFFPLPNLTVSFDTCLFQPPPAPVQSTLPPYSIVLLVIAGVLLGIAIIISVFFFMWLKRMRRKLKENDDLVLVQEATLRKREQTLTEATAATEAADRELMATSRAKSLLLSTSSHELKTPINSILGLSSLLTLANHAEIIGDISIACNEMVDLITAIIDASKIESNSLSLFASKFNPSETIYELVREFSWAGRVYYLAHESTPALITSDLIRFIEILKLVLKNSIQFAKTGPIILLSYSNNGQFCVICSDEGPGIPIQVAQNIDHLFFSSAEQQDISGSSGMGFPISIALTKLLNGTFTIATNETGTSSIACFPLAEVKPHIKQKEKVAFIQKEDSWYKRLAFGTLARNKGKVPYIFPSGKWLGLPINLDMDDTSTLCEFVKKPIVYKSDPEFTIPDIPIFKCTATETDSIEASVEEEYETIYIEDTGDFNFKTPSYRYAFYGEGDITYPDFVPERKKCIAQKILIVDDEPFNIKILRSQLKKLGMEADSANSGQEAINYIKKAEEIPTVIFIDMNMPGMNGIETTRAIKNIVKENIKFICTSAESIFDTSDFHYVLQKPITISKLEAALDISR